MRLQSRSPDDTEEIGFRLGKILREGDVVGLYGDLGTGKTTMVRGVARALGIDRRDVTSASFTIIAEYPGSPPFYHIDLYRIGAGNDLESTGIWDCLGRNSVSVIEWAEKLGNAEIGGFIRVFIEDAGNDRREVTIEGIDEENRDNL